MGIQNGGALPQGADQKQAREMRQTTTSQSDPKGPAHPSAEKGNEAQAARGLQVSGGSASAGPGADQPGGLETHRRNRLVVLAALLITYGYFTPSAQWNENSRYNLTRSLVERGRLNIDPYHENTGDKSYRLGHYYTDKAPGLSFLGVPGYALFFGARRLAGKSVPSQQIEVWPGEYDPYFRKTARSVRMKYDGSFWRGLYVANLFTNVLLAALAGVMLFGFLMRRSSGNLAVSLFGTMAYCLGTLAWPYATLFYGHQVAGSLLLIAFCIIDIAFVSRPAERLGSWFRKPVFTNLALGAIFGLAVAVEYPAAIACALLGAYAVYRNEKGRRLRAALWIVVAGLPFAVLLGLYHTVCFGSPFSVGYDHLALETFASGMGQGLYGVTYPRPWVALQILAGNHRGLFYHSPVLVLAIVGVARMWKGSLRLEGILVTSVVVYFVALNSAYYMWDGGAASGPRHCVPMLGFAALAAAAAYPASRSDRWKWARRGCWLLLVLSVANMLAITAVGPEAPMNIWDPLMEHAWPSLLTGDIAQNVGSTNVGLMFRIPGTASLLPLIAVWGLAAAAILLGDRMREPS
jgi:hypothetical protein